MLSEKNTLFKVYPIWFLSISKKSFLPRRLLNQNMIHTIENVMLFPIVDLNYLGKTVPNIIVKFICFSQKHSIWNIPSTPYLILAI